MLKLNSNIINTNPVGVATVEKVLGVSTNSRVSGDVNNIYISPISEPTYSPEATALFSRMMVQPSTALKELVDKTITDLKSAGIWDITDKFHKWDLHTEQASLLDWKNAAHNATNFGGTFTPKYGVQTALGVSYLDLNFTPSTDCTFGTINDFAFSLDDLTAEITNSYNFGAYNKANTSFIGFRTMEIGAVRPWLFINSMAQKVWNGNAGINLYYNERPNATQIFIYKSPSTYTFGTSNSVAMIDQSLVIGGNRYSNGGVYKSNISTSAFWLGKTFTPAQRTAWYEIINYWKTNVNSTF
jgi:hypothetical protein